MVSNRIYPLGIEEKNRWEICCGQSWYSSDAEKGSAFLYLDFVKGCDVHHSISFRFQRE